MLQKQGQCAKHRQVPPGSACWCGSPCKGSRAVARLSCLRAPVPAFCLSKCASCRLVSWTRLQLPDRAGTCWYRHRPWTYTPMAPSPGEPAADGSHTQQNSFAITPAHWSPLHVGLKIMQRQLQARGAVDIVPGHCLHKNAHPQRCWVQLAQPSGQTAQPHRVSDGRSPRGDDHTGSPSPSKQLFQGNKKDTDLAMLHVACARKGTKPSSCQV